MKQFLIITLSILSFNVYSQRNEKAWIKAKAAIQLMDEGKIDESIKLLKECEKIDPEDYTYPYEIAYAYSLKKEYDSAIEVLEKTKKYKNINSQVYQLSGNCYDYKGDFEKAIAEYDKGIKKFPKSGSLHLEKGVALYGQKKYNEAVQSFEEGVTAEPMYPSNYYKLASMYLDSTDKLTGVIYGEIFMNLERSSKRTRTMSKMLFDTYKKSIQFKGDETKIDFCEVIIKAENLKKKLTLPLCGVFGTHFIMATLGQKEVTLKSLAEMRIEFIKNFYKEDYKKYPNVLFQFQKELLDNENLQAYSIYLFQFGAEKEFDEWKINNGDKYDKFITWYTEPKNYFQVDKKTKFIKE